MRRVVTAIVANVANERFQFEVPASKNMMAGAGNRSQIVLVPVTSKRANISPAKSAQEITWRDLSDNATAETKVA